MAGNINLSISLRTSGQTAALKSGDITIPGVTLNFVEVKPQVAAFRRMVRSVEFDVCELASTTYMVARAYGAPFKALPIFLNRRFHHHGMVVRPDAGINEPKDLEGKKVGVRAYSVTTGVWTRGILQNEYGVDPSLVTWMVDDEEHVEQLKLPDNVVHVPEGKSLASMMAAGEIDAGMLGNAGIGREGPPTENWAASKAPATDSYRELIPDAAKVEAEWFSRTGIYPFHPTIVIKDEIAAAHPELPKALYNAMTESKKLYLEKLNSGEANEKADTQLRKLAEIVGADPVPYGLEANMPTIEALMTYAVQQKLMPSPMDIADLFHDPDSN
jgi:4,5-dihydroxyphthalate decarboxylase